MTPPKCVTLCHVALTERLTSGGEPMEEPIPSGSQTPPSPERTGRIDQPAPSLDHDD